MNLLKWFGLEKIVYRMPTSFKRPDGKTLNVFECGKCDCVMLSGSSFLSDSVYFPPDMIFRCVNCYKNDFPDRYAKEEKNKEAAV